MTTSAATSSTWTPLWTRTCAWGLAASLLSAAAFGCASAPRPVPLSNQPVASGQAAGVSVSVPRLDESDFPGDVLDVSTAVLVVIENRSPYEILITPETFTLGEPGGTRYSPMTPDQLALQKAAPEPSLNTSGVALAWRGGGRSSGHFGGHSGGVRIAAPVSHHSSGFRSAPSYRSSHSYSSGSRYGSHSYRSSGGYSSSRRYYSSGARGYYSGRPWWGRSNPWMWGAGYGLGWYGSSVWWNGPQYENWTRTDATQLALPASRLPPGGRTGGFLYFPKMEGDGAALSLQWQVRDASGQQVMGDIQVDLELTGD